jgi:hypothetical protein
LKLKEDEVYEKAFKFVRLLAEMFGKPIMVRVVDSPLRIGLTLSSSGQLYAFWCSGAG